MAVIAAVELTSAKAVSTTVHAILDVLDRYRLDPAPAEARSKFVPVIQQKVEARAPVHLVLPGFPFKSPNATAKVFGTLPDKAEEFALAHLDALCRSIGDVYKGGAELTIVSDGLVYNGMIHPQRGESESLTDYGCVDILGVPDRDVWAYGQAVREMAQQKGFRCLKFARLHSLQHSAAELDALTEAVYLQHAASFRENLQSGVPTTGIAEHLASDEDARATYNGYTRILADDLAGTERADEEEVTAKKMIARGRVRAENIALPQLLTQPPGLRRRDPENLPRLRPAVHPPGLRGQQVLHLAVPRARARRHAVAHDAGLRPRRLRAHRA